jgi:hypothetical protein
MSKDKNITISLVSRADLEKMAKDIAEVQQSFKNVTDAIDELLASEDNAGCDSEYTVVSMAAIKKLRELRGNK